MAARDGSNGAQHGFSVGLRTHTHRELLSRPRPQPSDSPQHKSEYALWWRGGREWWHVRCTICQATARDHASKIRDQARYDAEVMRRDADAYVVEVLARLEDEILNNLSVVRNGIASLNGHVGRQDYEE